MIYPASRGYLQGPPFRGWMVCLLCAFAGMIQAEVPTGSPITPAEVEDAGSWVIFDFGFDIKLYLSLKACISYVYL